MGAGRLHGSGTHTSCFFSWLRQSLGCWQTSWLRHPLGCWQASSWLRHSLGCWPALLLQRPNEGSDFKSLWSFCSFPPTPAHMHTHPPTHHRSCPPLLLIPAPLARPGVSFGFCAPSTHTLAVAHGLGPLCGGVPMTTLRRLPRFSRAPLGPQAEGGPQPAALPCPRKFCRRPKLWSFGQRSNRDPDTDRT